MNQLTMPNPLKPHEPRMLFGVRLMRWAALMVSAIVVCGCGKSAAPASEPTTAPAPAPIPDSVEAPTSAKHFKHSSPPPKPEEVPATGATAPAQKFDGYSVSVSADAQLEIPGKPGVLSVWIGESGKAPAPQSGEDRKTSDLGTTGQTARVEPFAPGMKVEPKESICEKIDPSGSELRFQISPIDSGDYEVGANVQLYASSDCTGAPVPKTTKSIEVKVKVSKAGVAKDALMDLVDPTWKAFLSFWDKLLVLVFALLLFLIRKRLYKWFGFKPKE